MSGQPSEQEGPDAPLIYVLIDEPVGPDNFGKEHSPIKALLLSHAESGRIVDCCTRVPTGATTIMCQEEETGKQHRLDIDLSVQNFQQLCNWARALPDDPIDLTDAGVEAHKKTFAPRRAPMNTSIIPTSDPSP